MTVKVLTIHELWLHAYLTNKDKGTDICDTYAIQIANRFTFAIAFFCLLRIVRLKRNEMGTHQMAMHILA